MYEELVVIINSGNVIIANLQIGVIMFVGYFISYVVRYNVSVHILDMTMNAETSLSYSNSSIIARARDYLQFIRYDTWRIAVIFSAYYFGYVICFPIFHNLGDRVGPTNVTGVSGAFSGILNCLTPPAAYYGFWVLFVIRMLVGFCAGAMIPSMIQIIRHWVPPTERHYFMWSYCGLTMGTFSTFLICAAMQYYATWSIGFYLTGGCQIVWAIVWFAVVTDSPSTHSFISNEELEYLNKAIGTIVIKLSNSQTPWRLILKSCPFWALCILNFGYAWIIVAVCLHAPLFYHLIIQYNIYNASALTALPFFLRWILGSLMIQLFHWYRHTHKATAHQVRQVRKYLIVVSHVIPGLVITSTWLTVLVPGPIMLTTAVALTAAGLDLTLDLCYELSPAYVTPLNTAIKTIGNIPGILIALSVGDVTTRYHNHPLVWKHIWCFHATVLLASGIIFLIWGETKIQPWNSIRQPVRPRNIRITIKPSIMSNIEEIEEDETTTKQAHSRRNSTLLNPFKMLQQKSSFV